ncbi:MAG TPA: hydroxyquinol 1,2-dioxygenase, partial [Usitatibacter sp.]|nr:hydroxyquinol 1,2-dioxygenase [Usitatibacter sp.]
ALIDVWSVDGGGYYDMQTSSEMRARAKFRSDEAGRYWFWSIRPRHYPIPTDGPVGAMLEAMGRHCYRPAHMHLAVRAEGYVPLTTQLFDAQSEFLDSDAVFGVRDSLIVEFQKHAPGAAADGRALSVPYYTVDFDLRLAPEKPRRSLAAAQRAELA